MAFKLLGHISAIVLCWTITVDKPLNVVDGDTFDVNAEIWLDSLTRRERIRVLNVDTPERGQSGYDAAKAFTTIWLAKGTFFITTCLRDRGGRALGIVYRDADILAEKLKEAGLVKKGN